jgi:hypothetical protein
MTQVIITTTGTGRVPAHPVARLSARLRVRQSCRTIPAIVPGLMLLLLAVMPARANDDPRLESSRHYAATLQAQLGARLKSALAEGGPVAAIEVCQIEAPRIAGSLATGGLSRVGRTALKVRNPANAPDQDARQVLERFDCEIGRGADLPLENFSTTPEGGARYMQAIITQPMCLTCHGSLLAEEVKAAIEQRYPDDQATGFTVGDLRGAFIIDWPSSEQPQH